MHYRDMTWTPCRSILTGRTSPPAATTADSTATGIRLDEQYNATTATRAANLTSQGVSFWRAPPITQSIFFVEIVGRLRLRNDLFPHQASASHQSGFSAKRIF